jgi:hypothetical protein
VVPIEGALPQIRRKSHATEVSSAAHNRASADLQEASGIGTTRARENTGGHLSLVTDGDDQAVVELETLIAPPVVAFPSG